MKTHTHTHTHTQKDTQHTHTQIKLGWALVQSTSIYISIKYINITSQPMITHFTTVKLARVNVFIDLPRLPIDCGKYFTTVNVSGTLV